MEPAVESFASRDARGNSAGCPHQRARACRRVRLRVGSGRIRRRARPGLAAVHHRFRGAGLVRAIEAPVRSRSCRVGRHCRLRGCRAPAHRVAVAACHLAAVPISRITCYSSTTSSSNGHLVHDRSLEGAMGEMAHYTPGAHLLAVIAGSWFGVDGLRAFYPLLVLCAALTAGFVFLIARRLLPAGAVCHRRGDPAVSCRRSISSARSRTTAFSRRRWRRCSRWRRGGRWSSGTKSGRRIAAISFSIFLVAVFLSWPVLLGPLLVCVSFAHALTADRAAARAVRQPRDRARCRCWSSSLVHAAGRWGWLGIVRTSGAVLQPSTRQPRLAAAAADVDRHLSSPPAIAARASRSCC